MTHTEFIKSKYIVLAEAKNAILFVACGELCCEINGHEFACKSISEFNELVEQFGDDDLSE